jgi:hypothetical protein
MRITCVAVQELRDRLAAQAHRAGGTGVVHAVHPCLGMRLAHRLTADLFNAADSARTTEV